MLRTQAARQLLPLISALLLRAPIAGATAPKAKDERESSATAHVRQWQLQHIGGNAAIVRDKALIRAAVKTLPCLKGHNDAAYTAVYSVDLNGDGTDEYIVQSEGGDCQMGDNGGSIRVLTRSNNRFHPISDEAMLWGSGFSLGPAGSGGWVSIVDADLGEKKVLLKWKSGRYRSSAAR